MVHLKRSAALTTFSYHVVMMELIRACSLRRNLARFLRHESRIYFARSKSRKRQVLIVFSMQIVAPDEKRAEILRTLGSFLGPTRAAAGCMQVQLCADLDKRKTLLLIEEWESR